MLFFIHYDNLSRTEAFKSSTFNVIIGIIRFKIYHLGVCFLFGPFAFCSILYLSLPSFGFTDFFFMIPSYPCRHVQVGFWSIMSSILGWDISKKVGLSQCLGFMVVPWKEHKDYVSSTSIKSYLPPAHYYVGWVSIYTDPLIHFISSLLSFENISNSVLRSHHFKELRFKRTWVTKLISRVGILAAQGCHNRWPPTEGLKTTEMYPFTVQESRSLKSWHWQASFLL